MAFVQAERLFLLASSCAKHIKCVQLYSVAACWSFCSQLFPPLTPMPQDLSLSFHVLCRISVYIVRGLFYQTISFPACLKIAKFFARAFGACNIYYFIKGSGAVDPEKIPVVHNGGPTRKCPCPLMSL